MAASPETKHERLIDEMNQFGLSNLPDEFTVRKLEKKATKLMEVDYFGANQILGMLYSITEDIAKMNKHFERAIQGGHQNIHLSNYAITLSRAGFASKAIEFFEDLYEKEHDLPSTIRNLVLHTQNTGLITKSLYWAEKLEQIAPTKKNKEIITASKTMYSLITKFNISEQDVALLLNTGFDILRNNGIYLSNIHQTLNSDCIYFNFNINRSGSVIEDLEDQLYNELEKNNLIPRVTEHFDIEFNNERTESYDNDVANALTEIMEEPDNLTPINEQLISEIEEVLG